MLHVAIVEDEPLMGRLLKESLENDNMKVKLYSSGVEVLEHIDDDRLPDVVLMDINIPDISGIELTYILKNRYPHIEIIVQTVIEDIETIIKAIKAGASGYMLKASMSDDVLNAIDMVMKGGSFLTGKVAKKVLLEFNRPVMREHEDLTSRFGAELYLSKREEEMLQELINGASYRDIATKFDITTATVNSHIRRIYQKMQVKSRGEAVAKAIVEMRKRQEIG